MVLRKYGNGRTAVVLEDEEGLYAVATVNLPDEPLEDGYVFVKDYSENEGMLQALVDAGIVERTDKDTVQSGYVEVPVAKLTIKESK